MDDFQLRAIVQTIKFASKAEVEAMQSLCGAVFILGVAIIIAAFIVRDGLRATRSTADTKDER